MGYVKSITMNILKQINGILGETGLTGDAMKPGSKWYWTAWESHEYCTVVLVTDKALYAFPPQGDEWIKHWVNHGIREFYTEGHKDSNVDRQIEWIPYEE